MLARRFLLISVMALMANVINAKSVVYNTTGIHYLWDSSDRIGFLTGNGLQIGFGVTDVANEGYTAVTSGYGWALKAGSTYYAYAPYNASYSVDENVASQLPVNYESQEQEGNDNANHLADRLFLSGKVDVTAASTLTPIVLRPLTSVLRIERKFAKAAEIKKVELSVASKLIPLAGYMDITKGSFVPTELASDVTLGTRNMHVDANGTAVVYLTLPPCQLAGNTLTITFVDADDDRYDVTLDAFNVESGYTYCIGGNASPSTSVTYDSDAEGTPATPVIVTGNLPVYGSWDVTGIDNVRIEHSAKAYDMLGRSTRASQRGIEIINGKKIIKR